MKISEQQFAWHYIHINFCTHTHTHTHTHRGLYCFSTSSKPLLKCQMCLTTQSTERVFENRQRDCKTPSPKIMLASKNL